MRWVHCTKYLYCDWSQHCHVMWVNYLQAFCHTRSGLSDQVTSLYLTLFSTLIYIHSNMPDTKQNRCYSYYCCKMKCMSNEMKCMSNMYCTRLNSHPDSTFHGAIMGPTWVLSAPDGPHDGPINLAIRAMLYITMETSRIGSWALIQYEVDILPV